MHYLKIEIHEILLYIKFINLYSNSKISSSKMEKVFSWYFIPYSQRNLDSNILFKHLYRNNPIFLIE